MVLICPKNELRTINDFSIRDFLSINGKRIFSIASKIIILIALYKIYTWGNWRGIVQLLNWKGALMLGISIGIYGIKQSTDAFRSKRLAHSLNIPLTYLQVLKFNMQAVAFDFVISIPQSEEIYRFERFSAYTDKKRAALLTFSIKATGLIATAITLLLTVVFTSLKLKPVYPFNISFWYYFIIIDLVVVTGLAVFYILRRQQKDHLLFNKILEWIRIIKQSFIAHRYNWLEAVVMGLLSQLIYAAAIYTFVLGNDASVSFLNVYLLVPLIYFGGMVPVGVAGIGLKEAVIVWGLQQFGVLSAYAWNIGLLHLALMLFYISIGVLLFLFDRKPNGKLV